MRKQEVIFVPAPAIGHFVPVVGFAKSLISHEDHITVTVVVMKPPIAAFIDSYINNPHPRMQFVQLPETVYPPEELLVKALESYSYALMGNSKPHVRTLVSEIVSSARVAALVIDTACVTMIDIGNEFGIPSYIYSSSGARNLSFMLSIPGRHKEVGTNSDPELSLTDEVLPSRVFSTREAYNAYVKLVSRLREAKGIVVNTFTELESDAINSLSDGENPPIYPVGPILELENRSHPELNRVQWDKTMKWLDEQPQSSVLFLCFGSFGGFSVTQVEEIALGLEKSGYRFLWCLRTPLGPHAVNGFKNPEEMLPEGFLERIGERGIVCGWASQVEVLGHNAIGGFVSHCGWNSILESLWFGVPIVTLPIYAEQQLNAFLMVKELGLAEELRLDYTRDHLVKAHKIERVVKSVMQSDNVVRKKVKEMSEMARKAVMEGGSSSASILKFIQDIS